MYIIIQNLKIFLGSLTMIAPPPSGLEKVTQPLIFLQRFVPTFVEIVLVIQEEF